MYIGIHKYVGTDQNCFVLCLHTSVHIGHWYSVVMNVIMSDYSQITFILAHGAK